jgi:glycine/D-amino acid oxidase-like deaminating enzyme
MSLGGRIFPTRQEVFYFGTVGNRRFSPPICRSGSISGATTTDFPDIDGHGFKVAHDSHGEAFDPDTPERLPTPARIVHAREFLARRFPELAEAPLLATEVCQYENTWNGDFVIDRHPAFDNVWIAGGGFRSRFQAWPGRGRVPGRRMLEGRAGRTTLQHRNQAGVQKREVH